MISKTSEKGERSDGEAEESRFLSSCLPQATGEYGNKNYDHLLWTVNTFL